MIERKQRTKKFVTDHQSKAPTTRYRSIETMDRTIWGVTFELLITLLLSDEVSVTFEL